MLSKLNPKEPKTDKKFAIIPLYGHGAEMSSNKASATTTSALLLVHKLKYQLE